jgi:hypothetical protein
VLPSLAFPRSFPTLFLVTGPGGTSQPNSHQVLEGDTGCWFHCLGTIAPGGGWAYPFLAV